MAVEIARANSITINNMMIENLTAAETGNNGIISLGINDQATINIDQFNVSDSGLTNTGSFIYIVGSGMGSLMISNLEFDTLILSNEVSLVSFQGLSNSVIQNALFSKITDFETNDDTNTIIDLRSIYSTENSNISLNDVTITYSSVSVFRISNIAQTTTIDQQVSITNMTVQHCLFEFSDDILHSGFVQSDGAFLFEFDQFFFQQHHFCSLVHA